MATVELLTFEFGVIVMCDTYVSASFLSLPKLSTPLSATLSFHASPGSSPSSDFNTIPKSAPSRLANISSALLFASSYFNVISLSVPRMIESSSPIERLVSMVKSSIAPEPISTLVISTSPDPCGEIVIFPFGPSVIVIDPVVLFPVFSITSLSPLEENTPAALPVPPLIIPLIKTVPSAAFVMDSSFSKIKPAAPVISTLEEAVISAPDTLPAAPKSPLNEVVLALIKIVPSVVFVMDSSFSKIKPAAPVISTLEEAVISVPDKLVNAPVDGELSPIGVVFIDPLVLVKRTVPLSLGKVIVRSEVGSVTASVVSYESSVSPSSIKGSAPVRVPIVVASIPVKLEPSPKNFVAVRSPVTVTSPDPRVIRSSSLIWPM